MTLVKKIAFGLFLVFLFLLSLVGFGQTVVSPASPITDICVGSVKTLSDITIVETSTSGFSGSGTFILKPPSNFEFVPGTGLIVVSGGGISTSGALTTATEITATFSVINTASFDFFSITGLQVKAIAPASSGNITRGVDTFVTSGGQANVGSTSYGFLSSITPPSITNQPAGQSICAGGTLSLSVVADGSGLSYQWQNDASGSYSDIVGATSSSYVKTNVSALDAANYRVIVTGSSSCIPVSIQSNSVGISIDSPASIVAQPISQGLCEGSSINLNIAANGSNLTYQWKKDGVDIPGETTAGYLKNNALLVDGGNYSVLIKSSLACGFSLLLSNNAIVTVNPKPTVMIANPAAVCSPAAVDITAASVTAGSTGGLTYSYWTNAGATAALSSPSAVSSSGTYYIKGMTGAGCFDVKPVVVTVNPTPTVVITNPAAVCSPATVDITAASVTVGSTGGLTYSYWTNAGATTALSSPSAVSSSGTYYIKGTTGAGCFDVKPVVVTVNPAPTVVITNPAAVCSPVTVDITAASVTVGSTGGLTYSYWTNAGATAALSSPSAVSSSGTYYIKGTTGAGCFDVKPVVVTVNPAPTVVITNPAAVCSPATVDITAASVTTGSTGGLTYTYWTDASTTTALSSPSGVSSSGTYYIKGTTGAGCFDVKPVVVTVNPTPTLVITNPAAVCSPATVDITAASVTVGSTGGLTYSYWTDAGATAALSSPSVASSSGNYYIKGTTGAGCFDVKPVVVTVNPTPTVVITNPAAVCSPATVDITAASVTVGSTGGLTYSYWTNAGTTTALSSPSAVSSSGTYYIKGTTGTGCFDVRPVVVTVNPTPTVITNPAAVCSPATVDLTAASVTAGSTGGLTYSYWTDAGATAALSSPSAVSSSGNYYIKGTTGAGCFDVKPVVVTVNPTPTVLITNPAAVCSPATVDITVASVTTGSTGGLTYSYWTNAGTTTALSSPSAVSSSGTYYIKGTTGAGCFDVKPVVVTVNPTPTVVITNPAAVCSPATVDITAASVTAGSTGGLTYSYWTDAGATIALSSPSAVSSSGTYYVKGVTGASCFDVKPIVLTISALPTTSSILGPSNVCANANGIVYSVNNSVGSLYSWSISGGVQTSGSNTNNITVSWGSGVAGNVSVTETNISGCVGLPVDLSTIISTCVTDITINNPSNSVCPGTTNVSLYYSNLVGSPDQYTIIFDAAAQSQGFLNVPYSANNLSSNPLVINLPAGAVPGTYSAFFTAKNSTSTIATPSYPLSFTIYSPPVVNAISPQLVCNSSSTNPITFSGTGTSYDWTNSNTSIGLLASGSGDIATFTATNSTSIPVFSTITVTPRFTSGVTCSGNSKTFTITVNPTPTVNVISNQVVCNNSNTAAVSFSGTGTSYDWTNDTNSVGLGSSGTGDIPSFLAINGSTSPIVATITVTPRFISGVTCSGSSRTFTITVNPTPTVNAIPSQVVCNNTSTTTISFTGTGASYDWTNSNTSIGLAPVGSGDIVSFTGVNGLSSPVIATITVTPRTTSGVTCSGVPQVFSITVNPTPTVNVISNQVVCNNSNTAAVSFSGTGTSYDWTNDTNSVGLGSSGAGNISSFLAINGSSSPVVATITATPRFTSGVTCFGSSRTFTITVNPTPTVNAIPSQVICNNTSTTAISFTGTGTSYDWTNSNTSIGLAPVGSGDIVSFTGVNGLSSPVIATITVTPRTTSGVTCSGVPQVFSITVNPTPTVNVISNQVVCNNSNTTAVSFSGTGTSYDWTNDTNSVGLGSSGAGNIPSFLAINGSSSPVVATITATPRFTSGVTCSGSSRTFTITVNPTPTVNAIPSQLICNNTSTTTISFTGTGTSYDWTNSNTSIGLAPVGSGDIVSFTGVNGLSSPVFSTITVTPRFTSGVTCSGTSKTFTITVNPTPTVNVITNQMVCDNSNTAAVSFSGTGTSYDWSNDTNSVGLGSSGIGDIASFLAINGSSSPVVATITVTPRFASGATCSGSSRTFTITVNPTPIVDPISPQIVCNNTTTTTISFTGTGTSYDWVNDNSSIGLPSGGSGDINIFIASNNTSLVAYANIDVTPRYTVSGLSCFGTAQSFTFEIRPTPTLATNVSNQSICDGTISNIVLSNPNNIAGTKYIWSSVQTGLLGATSQSSGLNGPIGDLLTLNSPTNEGSAIYSIQALVNGCVSPPKAVEVSVKPIPDVQLSSASLAICSGGAIDVLLTNPNNIANTTYNWVASGVNVTGASNASGSSIGEINQVLTTIETTPQIINYTISTTAGICTGSSKTLQVTVNPNPDPPALPASVSVCTGVTYNSAPANTGLTYSWVPLSSFNVSGATSNTGPQISQNLLTIDGINPGTVIYQTKNVSSAGCLSQASFTVATVNPAPDFFLTNTSPSICSGSPTDISFLSSVSGAQIKLISVDYTGLTGGSLTSGVSLFVSGQSLRETLVNSTNAPITITYTFQATVSGVCGSILSTKSTDVTIIPDPSFTLANAFPSLCSGSSTSISLTSPTLGAAIKLLDVNYNGVSSSVVRSLGEVFSTGDVIADVLTNNTNSPLTVSYTFQVSAGGCTSVTTRTASVVVNPIPNFITNNVASAVCSGSAANIVLNSPVAGSQVKLISLNYGNATGTLVAGALYTDGQKLGNLLFNNTNSPTTVTFVFQGITSACQTSQTKTETITVNPNPSFSIANNLSSICSDTPTDLAISSSTIGHQVNLERVNYGFTTGGNLIAGTSVFFHGDRIQEVLKNTTNNPIDVVYVFNVTTPGTSPSCPNNPVSQTIIVTVQPSPTFSVVNSAASICNGNLTAIGLNSSVTGAQIRLRSVDYGGGSGSINYAPNTRFNSGQQISEVLSNSTQNLVRVKYDLEAVIGTCAPSTNQVVTVDVNLSPVFTIANTSAIICKQGSTQITLNTESANTIVKLQDVKYNGIIGSLVPPLPYTSGQTISETLTNNTSAPIDVVYTFTASAPGCVDAGLKSTTVSVKPLPLVSFGGLNSQVGLNSPKETLVGNQLGGVFSISPASSALNIISPNPTDQSTFTPSQSTLGSNVITYSFTDINGCTNQDVKTVVVSALSAVDFKLDDKLVVLNGLVDNSSSTGEIEVCANKNPIRLTGNQVVKTGTTTVFSSPTNGLVVFDGTNYNLHTSNVASGIYEVEYRYTDALNSTTSVVKNIKIKANPVAAINGSRYCISDKVTLTDGSTISTKPFTASIIAWDWESNATGSDNQRKSDQNPTFNYSVFGDKNVTLAVTTDQGCSDKVSKNIRIGPVPDVRFSWSAICNGDSTNFTDSSKVAKDYSKIVSWNWTFGDRDGNNKTIKAPKNKYANPGTYDVRLTVTTDDGCVASKQKKLFILPSIQVTQTSAYYKDFETIDNGWIPGYDSAGVIIASNDKTSWIWSSPLGTTIKSNSPNSKAWWTGNFMSTALHSYASNERSVVNGPCFDLSDLKRPMISLDYFVNAQDKIDGAVLQYSTDNVTWFNVGVVGGGINWFNRTGITSNPGRQLVGQYGWSDTTKNWKNGRSNLDTIPKAQRKSVRLRFAFASDNTSRPTDDGFAFDNIYVGEKQRNVLLEHFTNYNSVSGKADDDRINRLYVSQSQAPNFNSLQYHINFPSTDSLNTVNPGDPAARTLYYGLTQNAIVLDGNKQFAAAANAKVVIDQRSLVSPKFDLALTASQGTSPFFVNFSLAIKPLETFNADNKSPVLVYVALLENNIQTPSLNLRSILRKQLLGSDGKTRTDQWKAGEVKFENQNEIPLTGCLIKDPSNLSLIAFIQDKNTKEIYQSVILKGPNMPQLKSSPVTGLEDLLVGSEINVFPNPAKELFKFQLPNGISSNALSWRVFDQRGIEVLAGDFNDRTNDIKEVSIKGLSSGVYHILIEGHNKSKIYKKLVVFNGN